MILKKMVEIIKEIPSEANPKKWLENGWVEVVNERWASKPKPKPKAKPKKKTSKKK